MRRRTGIAAFVTAVAASALAATAVGPGAQASVANPGNDTHLIPGDLLVSTSYYTNDPNIVAGQTILPPGSGSAGKTAIAGGDYPYVFNNDTVDGSFRTTANPSHRRQWARPAPGTRGRTCSGFARAGCSRCERGHLYPGAVAELAQDVLEVGVDGPLGHDEARRDVPVGQAFGD